MSDAQRQAMYSQIREVKGDSDQMYSLIDQLGASDDVNETRQKMYSQIGILKQSVDQMYGQIDNYGTDKPPVDPAEPSIAETDEPSIDAPALVPSGDIVELDLTKGSNFTDWFGRKPDYVSGEEHVKHAGNGFVQSFSPTSRGSTRTQAQISLPKDQRHTAYAVEMDIQFDGDFEWVKGGKFGMGMYCGYKKGRVYAGGGQNIPNACVARTMWRADGELAGYLYRQNKPPRMHRFGEDFKANKPMVAGQMHTITLGMKLNSRYQAKDGKLFLGLDGAIQEMGGINWMSAGDMYIKQILYTAFYGGSNSKWSPQSKTAYQVHRVRHFPIEA